MDRHYLGLLVGIQGMCHSNRGKKYFTVTEVNLSERHSERSEESVTAAKDSLSERHSSPGKNLLQYDKMFTS